MKAFRLSIVLFLFGVLALEEVCTGDEATKDFTLPSATGNSLVRLSDYSGKVVLINWWRTACGSCQQQTPKRVELDKPDGRVARHGGKDPALQQRQCQTCLQRGSIQVAVKC